MYTDERDTHNTVDIHEKENWILKKKFDVKFNPIRLH